MTDELKPFGLYIHVPFCLSKCDYCAFYSTLPAPELIDGYLLTLANELRHKLPDNCNVTTIFVGGGNPTSIGLEGIKRLVEIVRAGVCLEKCEEWTFETNPETISPQLALYLATITNVRVSMGIQRLCDNELEILGRRSNMLQINGALETLSSNLENIGIDLIMGVPGCSYIGSELKSLINRFDLKHVSAYFLTIEPGTVMQSKVSAGLLDDPSGIGPDEMFQLRDYLRDLGFEHYEISNYAKTGYRCRHNMNYWLQRDYLGVGPSAVSTTGKSRYSNIACLEKWLDGNKPDHEILTLNDQRNEFIMLRLRLVNDGLNLNELTDKFGPQPSEFLGTLNNLLSQKKLIRKSDNIVILSDQGLIVADELMASLFI